MSSRHLSLSSPIIDYSSIPRFDDDYNGSEDSDGINSYYVEKNESSSPAMSPRLSGLVARYSGLSGLSPVRPLKSPQRPRINGPQTVRKSPVLRHKPARQSLPAGLSLEIHSGPHSTASHSSGLPASLGLPMNLGIFREDDELEELKERFKKIGLEGEQEGAINRSGIRSSQDELRKKPPSEDSGYHENASALLQAEEEEGGDEGGERERLRSQMPGCRITAKTSGSSLGAGGRRSRLMEKSEWDRQEPISAMRTSPVNRLQLSPSHSTSPPNKPMLTRQRAAERQLLETLDEAKKSLEHDVSMVLLERVVSDTISLYNQQHENSELEHIDRLCLSISDYIVQLISSEKYEKYGSSRFSPKVRYLNNGRQFAGTLSSYSSPGYYDDTIAMRSGRNSAERHSAGRASSGLGRSSSYRLDLSNGGTGSPMNRIGDRIGGRISRGSRGYVRDVRRFDDRYENRSFA